MLAFFQRKFLFPRQFVRVDPVGGQGVPNLTRWWRETSEGRVEAWYLAGDGCTAKSPGPAVIFAHGNGESIDMWGRAMNAYRKQGISVLLPEYRGYGRSAGHPGQCAITEDYVYFYDRLVALPEVDPAKVVFHGRSLGGGVVGSLARTRKPAALILESTFTSITWFARRMFVPDFLVADPFDTLSVVETLHAPILIFHGRFDSLVPYVHGQQLQASAQNARLITYSCDHNDLPPDPAHYWGEIQTFLKTHL